MGLFVAIRLLSVLVLLLAQTGNHLKIEPGRAHGTQHSDYVSRHRALFCPSPLIFSFVICRLSERPRHSPVVCFGPDLASKSGFPWAAKAKVKSFAPLFRQRVIPLCPDPESSRLRGPRAGFGSDPEHFFLPLPGPQGQFHGKPQVFHRSIPKPSWAIFSSLEVKLGQLFEEEEVGCQI